MTVLQAVVGGFAVFVTVVSTGAFVLNRLARRAQRDIEAANWKVRG